MTDRTRSAAVAAVAALLLLVSAPASFDVRAQAGPVQYIAAADPAAMAAVGTMATTMRDGGDLRLRVSADDVLLGGRTVRQFDQYVDGVRVWGSGLSEQLQEGRPVAAYGVLIAPVRATAKPGLSESEAKAALSALAAVELGPLKHPELVWLPSDGTLTLAWMAKVFAPSEGAMRYFIDADTGLVLRKESVQQSQLPAGASVGHGRGVLGDDKKISTLSMSGGFLAFDTIRPPDISTYDLRGTPLRFLQLLNGFISRPFTSDYASTGSSNDWTDGAAVDAHVYASYTYDYYFKRFGRRGLDDRNLQILSLVHLVKRSDVLTASGSDLNSYYLNAGYYGDGYMVYGEGLPPNLSVGGKYLRLLLRGDRRRGARALARRHRLQLGPGVRERVRSVERSRSRTSWARASSSSSRNRGPGGCRPTTCWVKISRARRTHANQDGERSLADPGLFGQPDHYSKRLPVALFRRVRRNE